MKFIQVSEVFEQIERVTSRLEITRLLANLLDKATAHEAAIICDLSLGQLHPPYIGTKFNLAEKSIIKVLAEFLNCSESTIKQEAKKIGDVGAVLIEYEWPTEKDLSLLYVYDKLCHIEKVSGIGSQEKKMKELRLLLADLDPLSAKYVVRIIVGKIRLGFSDMTIVDALSWMKAGNKSLRPIIENAYNICADIGFIAETLKKEGIKALEKMHIKVGIPILPAAAERLPTAEAIIKKIGPCVVQPKFDGFRLQIHVDKTKKRPIIHFFSRNLQDMSDMFPDLKRELLTLPVEDIICEGEAIGYDPNEGIFLPFQETVKRKRKHGIEKAAADFPLKLFLFDLLYLNGKSLLNEIHEQRRKKLEKIFKNFKSDQIFVTEEFDVKNAQELKKQFANAISSGLEGLVVKRPNAIYQPGKRNFNWIKLKRQEEGQLEDTIDCVILGYYDGKGRRAAFGIGAFLVGVYLKKEDLFQTIAKIGTGLKDEDWIELKKKCDAIQVKKKPVNVECAKELVPDVWVAPEIVCVVRADEISLSPLHVAGKTKDKLGFALRFPRFMGYRPDKSPQKATQVSEIKRLYEDQFIR